MTVDRRSNPWGQSLTSFRATYAKVRPNEAALAARVHATAMEEVVAEGGDYVSYVVRFARQLLCEEGVGEYPVHLASDELAMYGQIVSPFELLPNEVPPFFTLHRLAFLTTCCESHLESNRLALLSTGHPSAIFPNSRWFDYSICRLYPFLVPSRYSILSEGDCGPYASYLWEGEEALPGLSTEAVDGLLSLRSKFLDLKLQVLHVLGEAVRRGDPDALWPECLRLLRGSLGKAEADKLAHVNMSIADMLDARRAELNVPSGMLRAEAGGLLDLLAVIAHFELILRHGAGVEMAETIERIAEKDGWRAVEDALRVMQRAPNRQPWEWALAEHVPDRESLAPGESVGRMGEIWYRMLDDVQGSLGELVKIERLAPTGYARVLRTCLDYQASVNLLTLESTGRLARTGYAPPGDDVDYGTNLLRKQGKRWEIIFNGARTIVPDSLGMRYIAHIVGEGPKEIHVRDIASTHRAENASGSTASGREVEPSDLEAQGLHVERGTPEADLADAREEGRRLQTALKRLMGQRAELTEDASLGLEERARELEAMDDAIEGVKKAISRQFGLGGRPRAKWDAHHRERIAVSKAILNAIAKIESFEVVVDGQPTLASHLRGGIRLGRVCWYRPTDGTCWHVKT